MSGRGGVMRPEHPRWGEFMLRLAGELYVGLDQKDIKVHLVRCSGTCDKPISRKLLEEFGNINIDRTFRYFERHGGWCDCEVLIKVAKTVKRGVISDDAERKTSCSKGDTQYNTRDQRQDTSR